MSILTLDPERFSLFSRRSRKVPSILRKIDPAPLPDASMEKEAQVKAAAVLANTLKISRIASEMKELADGFLDNFERRQ